MKDVSAEGKAQDRQEATRVARLLEYFECCSRAAEKKAKKEETQDVKA